MTLQFFRLTPEILFLHNFLKTSFVILTSRKDSLESYAIHNSVSKESLRVFNKDVSLPKQNITI